MLMKWPECWEHAVWPLSTFCFMKYRPFCFFCLRQTVQENMHFIIPLLSIKPSITTNIRLKQFPFPYPFFFSGLEACWIVKLRLWVEGKVPWAMLVWFYYLDLPMHNIFPDQASIMHSEMRCKFPLIKTSDYSWESCA